MQFLLSRLSREVYIGIAMPSILRRASISDISSSISLQRLKQAVTHSVPEDQFFYKSSHLLHSISYHQRALFFPAALCTILEPKPNSKCVFAHSPSNMSTKLVAVHEPYLSLRNLTIDTRTQAMRQRVGQSALSFICQELIHTPETVATEPCVLQHP